MQEDVMKKMMMKNESLGMCDNKYAQNPLNNEKSDSQIMDTAVRTSVTVIQPTNYNKLQNQFKATTMEQQFIISSSTSIFLHLIHNNICYIFIHHHHTHHHHC